MGQSTLSAFSKSCKGLDMYVYLMMIATFSFGNWSIYILAVGYDSSSLRVNKCGNSLNSRNFHCAKGVYARPPIEDGFL